MMQLEKAIEIVMDLAKQNLIDKDADTTELQTERMKQLEAIDVVEDHFVNVVWP